VELVGTCVGYMAELAAWPGCETVRVRGVDTST